MIMNILRPDRGRIRVLGRSVDGMYGGGVGYLPEERGLYRKMKVGDFLRFYGRLKNAANPDIEMKAWLDRFDLSDRINKKIETLSKGMSQKVQFIVAAMGRPELLILDEPFTGLDPVNMETLRSAVLEMRKKGTTVIFSTHDMAMAEALCDFIFMIHKGLKVLDGTLTSIQDQYHQDMIRIRLESGAGFPEGIEGIDRIHDLGQVRELTLKAGVDPQAILGRLCSSTRMTSFELARPSLHDIFLRIAGPGSKEGTDHA
jgi:ABC-2 type transport system ATP-binding protein